MLKSILFGIGFIHFKQASLMNQRNVNLKKILMFVLFAAGGAFAFSTAKKIYDTDIFEITSEGELDLYNLRLGSLPPKNATCSESYSTYDFCEGIKTDKGEEFEVIGCRLTLPDEDRKLGIKVTACISDITKKIGAIRVNVPPFKDETNTIQLAILKRLNHKFKNQGILQYPEDRLATGRVFELRGSRGEIITAEAWIGSLQIDLASPASIRMLYREHEELVERNREHIEKSSEEKSKRINLGI